VYLDQSPRYELENVVQVGASILGDWVGHKVCTGKGVYANNEKLRCLSHIE
jgi:hypothetical protein